MSNWYDLLNELKAGGSPHDMQRRKYLAELYERSKRNIIVYYSGWLQKGHLANFADLVINDIDKNGFMNAIHGLDRSKGLDLILHTPGGDTAAMESLVDYLRAMFGTDVRAIIPQIALSAGTMIALSCKEIIMGEHSSLGPIDPQISGLSAHGIIDEFKRAAEETRVDEKKIPLWQPIIAKYAPTFIGECIKAISWSEEMVKEWLTTGMFAGEKMADAKADNIIRELGTPQLTKSHSRHISKKRASDMGLKIIALEDDQPFQEAVLSVHHTCMLTLDATPAFKIIENHKGIAFIQSLQRIQPIAVG